VKRRRESKPDTPPAGVTAAEGSSARLKARDGVDWPVQISSREGDVLMLVLLAKGDRVDLGPGGGSDEPLMLECTSDHGVVRFPGNAQLEEPDLVRFRVQDVPEIEQRREYVRVRAPRQVVLAVSGTGTIDSAYSLDLSGGGMLLSGPDTLQIDDNIRFRLHLDSSSPPIRGRGRVVRVSGENQRAVVFEEISRQDRERLIHFIFDRQREARARTRDPT
jgi:PilZ domain